MDDNEILKALECCVTVDYTVCQNCPMFDVECACESELMKHAFDLITRQKAEIERLNDSIIELFTLVERICDNACKHDLSLLRANRIGGCDSYQGLPPICRIRDDIYNRYEELIYKALKQKELKEMVGEDNG